MSQPPKNPFPPKPLPQALREEWTPPWPPSPLVQSMPNLGPWRRFGEEVRTGVIFPGLNTPPLEIHDWAGFGSGNRTWRPPGRLPQTREEGRFFDPEGGRRRLDLMREQVAALGNWGRVRREEGGGGGERVERLGHEEKLGVLKEGVGEVVCTFGRLGWSDICGREGDWKIQEQLRIKRVDTYTVPEHTDMSKVVKDKSHLRYDKEKDCPVERGSGYLESTFGHVPGKDCDYATWWEDDPREFPKIGPEMEGRRRDRLGWYKEGLVAEWVGDGIVELKQREPYIYADNDEEKARFDELFEGGERGRKREPRTRTREGLKLVRYFDDEERVLGRYYRNPRTWWTGEKYVNVVGEAKQVWDYLGEEKDYFEGLDKEGRGWNVPDLRPERRGRERRESPGRGERERDWRDRRYHSMWRGDVREYRLRQRGDIKWDEYNSLWPRDNGVGNNFIHSTRLKARNDEFDGILRVLSADPDERQYLFKRIKYLMINTTPTWATMGPSRLLGQRWNFLARGSTGWPGQEITADGEEFVRRWEDFGNWWVAEIANQFKIDWKEMPRLQEVYLDLRGLNIPVRMEGESFIYVRCWSGFLLRSFVAKLAKSMSGLHLRRLTIAGLRSYVGKYGYDASSMRDETLNENDLTRGFWDDERELFVDESFCGEVDEAGNGVKTRFINWWMMFVTAVRPGGKLVFVDREYDAEAVIVTDRPDSSLHDWILKGGQPRTWRRDIPGQDDWHPTPAGPVPVVPKRERQPPGVVVEDLVTELKNL